MRKKSNLLVLFFFLFVIVLYVHNLTRDIYSGDIGDLVTAAAVFGVAHPPGYPLFSLLGGLLAHLPLPLPIVSRVALLSVLSSVSALILFYHFSLKVSKNSFIALLCTSILAFSYYFWFHTEIPEAFGLNNFLLIALMYCSYRFITDKTAKWLYLTAFLCGLSLTHHHTILFLFPGIFIIMMSQWRYIFGSVKRLIYAHLAFIAGLLPYFYVPLAASQNPPINWDRATTIASFIHLILRKDYGFAPSVVNEVPVSVKLIHVSSFLTSLVNSYSYQIIAMCLVGAVVLFFRNRAYFFGLLVSFMLMGPFFMYYAAGLTGVPVGMGIIERFYVSPTLLVLFFLPFGFSWLYSILKLKLTRPLSVYLLLSYFLIVPLMLLYYNFPKTDLSRTSIGNTLADNLFSYLPKDAVLFVSGDTTTFNVWYNYYVLKKRPDIGLINPPGVGGNQFFDEQINLLHEKFPKISAKELPDKTIEAMTRNRTVYTTYTVPFVPKGMVLLPLGMVYQIVPQRDIPTKEAYYNLVEPKLRQLKLTRKEALTPAESNLVAAEIPSIYANGLVRIADFIDSYYKDPVLAEHYYRRALWLDPEHPNAYSGLALVQFKATKDCTQSLRNMRTAITLYPVWKTYYLQYYLLLQGCKRSEREQTDFTKEYNRLFHEDLRTTLKKSYRTR